MKILIPTLTPKLDSEIDHQLGRGAYFLIVETSSMEHEAIQNTWQHVECSAGLKTSRLALDLSVEAVISRDCGPKAFSGLRTAGIAVYRPGESKNAREAIHNFLAGKLQEIHAPTLDGHTSQRKQTTQT